MTEPPVTGRRRFPLLPGSPPRGLNRLLWYAGVYSAGAAGLKLAGFLLFLWIARTLSVPEYGRFGMLFAVQTGVATFAVAGVIEGVVALTKHHLAPESRRRLYVAGSRVFLGTAIVTSVVAGVAFVATADDGTQMGTLFAALASGALLAAASLEAQLVRLEEDHLGSMLFAVAVPLAGFAGGFVAFLVDRSAGAYFVGCALGVATGLLLVSGRRVGLRAATIPAGTVRAVAAGGAPFVVVALFGWLNGYGNNYLVSGIFAAREVARFTFVLTLSSILQLVAAALNQVWTPRFYQITHQDPLEEVERKNRRFFRGQAIMLGLVGGVMVVVFPAAMRLLGGNLRAYASMSPELSLLLGYYVLAVPVWHCQNYFTAYGRGPEFMRVTILTGVAGLGLWIVLMRVLGPMGIYIGFIAQVALRAAGAVLTARRYWKLTIAWEGVAVGLALTLSGALLARL